MPDISEEFSELFRKRQKEYGESMRSRVQTDIRVERKENEPPRVPQQRTSVGPTADQRTRVRWLISNEMHRYMKKSTFGQGPPLPTPISRRVKRETNNIEQAVYDLLASTDKNKQIDPKFSSVFKTMIGKEGDLKIDEEFIEPTLESVEAQAVASFADNPAPVTLPPKEETSIPEGLFLDEDGKPRYAKGNPWGKKVGALAPTSLLES